MSKPYTHILELYPEGQNRQGQPLPSQSILYRVSDGMAIGARQGQMVSVGEDAKAAKVRTYRDEKYGDAALRKFADEDARMADPQRGGAHIEEIDCSHKVIQPSLGDITSISNGRRQ